MQMVTSFSKNLRPHGLPRPVSSGSFCRPLNGKSPRTLTPASLNTPQDTLPTCLSSLVRQAPWPLRTSHKPQPALRKLSVKGSLLSPFTALCTSLQEVFLIASPLPAVTQSPSAATGLTVSPSRPTWTDIHLPTCFTRLQ